MSSSETRRRFRTIAYSAAFAVNISLIVDSAYRPRPVQGSGSDTPIKVSGGAMTFHSRHVWEPYTPTGSTTQTGLYTCIPQSQTKFYAVALNEPDDPQEIPLSGNWSLQIKDYSPNPPLGPGTEGVNMQIADASSCDGDSNKEQLAITVFGSSASFYTNPGPSDPNLPNNTRFQDTCQADRDLCERMSHYTVTSVKPNIDRDCDKKECSLYIVNNVLPPSVLGQLVKTRR